MATAFRRVLVGFDGSPDSCEALRAATEIAGRDGGHVVALAVLRDGPSREGNGEPDSESGELRRLAEACFDKLRRGSQPAADSG